MSDYTDTIRRWATDIRRTGTLPDADGTGEVGLGAGESGHRLAARFTLKLELDRIADIRYQVFGCGFSMAACAVAADLSVGYSLREMLAIDATRIDDALEGLPADRRYCADLAADALQAAVRSAHKDHHPVTRSLDLPEEHGARIPAHSPVYAGLVNSARPHDVTEEDRHLFACALAVGIEEASRPAEAIGLTDSDVETLLRTFFPAVGPDLLADRQGARPISPPEINEEVLSLLLEHVPTTQDPQRISVATYLCHILAARAAHPGHLWVAMGLFDRTELTAAIRRHLPTLATANNQNMRWKRYLYKQVCDRNGGTLCKAPSCGACSDYFLCFADD